ncbi:hypothetical protein BH10ACI1_BH10ACI1_12800 [soil metagenome]
MSEHQISIADANENLLNCAAYLAETIKSADGRAEAMKEIIPRFLEKNEVDLAAGLADTIDDPFMRDLLLTQVAEKCAEIDDDEYAFQLIEAIEDYGNQARAREKLALQKASKGDLEKAFEIAETLEHPDEVFAEIALREAARGDESDALETVEEIEFPFSKVTALQNIAAVFIKKDENTKAVKFLEDAKKIAFDIEFTEEQIRAFIEIGHNFIEAKNNSKAIETFDTAKTIAENLDNVHRDSFLAGVALGFLHAGSVDLADRTLDLVADKTQISSCLIGFSQYYQQKSETADALEALEEAYAILKSQKDLEIRESRTRFRLWTTIAVLFANFEKSERAIEIAQEIPDESEQMSALAQIAQVFASQEKVEMMRQALQGITEDSNKMFAFIGISDVKNRSEAKAEALEYLNEAYFHAGLIHQLGLRSRGYNELANRFAQFDETAKAREIFLENLEAISQIKDVSNRAVALAQFADVYEQAELEVNAAEKELLESLTRKVGI